MLIGGDDKGNEQNWQAGQELIPFGKYKGQPVQVLRSDRGYTEWLLQQDWFVQRFPNLRTIIVNNFGQPSETPEHNKLQARFLSKDFCTKFAWLACAFLPSLSHNHLFSLIRKNDDEVCDLVIETYPEFEAKCGVDVCLCFFILWNGKEGEHCNNMEFKIEVKPTVSDDYPAVLREMKANESSFLVLSEYTGRGASKDDFVRIFKCSHKLVIFENEIDLAVPKLILPSGNEIELHV